MSRGEKMKRFFAETDPAKVAFVVGSRIPTIYTEPLSRSFSFFSCRRQASKIAMAEVESMEAKIAAIKVQFEKSCNDKESQDELAALAAKRRAELGKLFTV